MEKIDKNFIIRTTFTASHLHDLNLIMQAQQNFTFYLKTFINDLGCLNVVDLSANLSIKQAKKLTFFLP